LDGGLILENQRGSFAKMPELTGTWLVDSAWDRSGPLDRSGGWYATRRCGRQRRAPAATLGDGGSLA